jgi:AraC-like DNA-binding protein
MGLDWIDDLLQKAEGLPVLGGIAHDLRFAYEILRAGSPDPKPVQTQINTLESLHTRAANLLTSFNESLLTLRQSWTGEVADYYFGPQVTAFEIEHDMEPTTTGAGYQLWNRLNQLTATLEYTHAAHQKAYDVLGQLVTLQEELDTDVIESATLLGADVAEAAIPGAEELDLGTVPLTIERTGEAVQTAKNVEEVGQAVTDVEEVAQTVQTGITVAQVLKVVGTIGAIVGVALVVLLIPSDSGPSNSLPPLSDKKKISQLSDKEFNRMLADLAREFGCSQTEIENIINKYGANNLTPKQLERILRMLQIKAQLQALRDQLQNSNVPGASRLIKKIDQILQGLANQDPTKWTDDNIQTIEGQLNGIWGNFTAAQQGGGTLSQDHTCGGSTQEVDIDQGNTWVEVKNQSGLSPSSDKFTALFNQLLNYIKVGRCEGVNNFCIDVPPDADISGLQNAINGRLTQMGITGVKVDVCKTNFGQPPAPAGGWCTA